MTKLRYYLVLHLIGWDDGASFLNQSQSKVSLNQKDPDYSRRTIEIAVLFVRDKLRITPLGKYGNVIGWNSFM